jgi:Putative Ig domain
VREGATSEASQQEIGIHLGYRVRWQAMKFFLTFAITFSAALFVPAGPASAALIEVESVGESGDTPSALDNDFTRINQAINVTANNGDTIMLRGTFDWSEDNAMASWMGNDRIITANAGLHHVTLTAAALGDATVRGPGDLFDVEDSGFLQLYEPTGTIGNFQGWTFSNLVIEGFEYSILMAYSAGPATLFQDVVVENNVFRVPADTNGADDPKDLYQNIGLHYSFGMNQRISGNLFELDGSGRSNETNPASPRRSTTVGVQCNTSGGNAYEGLQITNNVVRIVGTIDPTGPAKITGIWENAWAHSSNITVSNNTIENVATGDDKNIRGFLVTSHSSSATTVRYAGNVLTNLSIGYMWMSELESPGTTYGNTVEPIVIEDTTVTKCAVGAGIRTEGRGAFYDSTFTDNTTAFELRSGTLYVGSSVVSKNVTGISGFSGAVTLEGSTLNDNRSGAVHLQGTAHLDAGGGGNSSGANVFMGYGGSVYAIDNRVLATEFAGADPQHYAQSNAYDVYDDAGIETLLFHTPDDATLGRIDFQNPLAPAASFTVADLAPPKRTPTEIVLQADPLSAQQGLEIVSGPAHGQLFLGATEVTGFPYEVPASNGSAVTLSYIPSSADSDAFTYRVTSDNVFRSRTGTVSLANEAPAVSGTPATQATAGTAYTFTASAADNNGDTLTASATGVPAWATFDAATLTLSGTPAASDVGGINDIVVTVSDGVAEASLPFSLTVVAASVPPVDTPPNDGELGTGEAPVTGDDIIKNARGGAGCACRQNGGATSHEGWLVAFALAYVIRRRRMR